MFLHHTYVVLLFSVLLSSRHGRDYDWSSQPIDPEATYASVGGQAHGR
jgi:hypothetical protein